MNIKTKIYNLKYKMSNFFYVLLLGLKIHKPTTKRCGVCGNKRMSGFSSLNKKYCSDCGTWVKWGLGKGQKNII